MKNWFPQYHMRCDPEIKGKVFWCAFAAKHLKRFLEHRFGFRSFWKSSPLTPAAFTWRNAQILFVLESIAPFCTIIYCVWEKDGKNTKGGEEWAKTNLHSKWRCANFCWADWFCLRPTWKYWFCANNFKKLMSAKTVLCTVWYKTINTVPGTVSWHSMYILRICTVPHTVTQLFTRLRTLKEVPYVLVLLKHTVLVPVGISSIYYLAVITVVVVPAVMNENLPPRITNKQCATSTIENCWYPQSVLIEGLRKKEDFPPPSTFGIPCRHITTLIPIKSYHLNIWWHKKYSALYLQKGCEEVTREMMEHTLRYDHHLIITSDEKKTLMETANRIELLRGTHSVST